MKKAYTKKITLAIFSILAVLLLTSFASALVFTSGPTNGHPISALTQNDNTVKLTLKNDNSFNQNISFTFEPTSISADGSSISLSVDKNNFQLDAGKEQVVIITGTFSGTFPFGAYSTTLKATGVDVSNSTNIVTASKTIQHFSSFCTSGPKRDDILEIKNIEINNLGESSGDDEEWFPFDEIEVVVEVENNGDKDKAEDDLEDLVIEIGLLDSKGENVIDKFEFDDEEEEEIGNLDPDDEDEVTFKFVLDEIDKDLKGNFDFVVKVFEDGNEDNVCVDFANDLEDKNDFARTIDIEREDDKGKLIQFRNTMIDPITLTCGDLVTLSTDVVNAGDEDQDQVKVNLYNRDLGLQHSQVIRSDLDEGDREKINFEFKVPADLKDGSYIVDLSADYDYDKDDDEYDESSDETEKILLTLIGCSVAPSEPTTPTTGKIASISASLDSDAKAGEEMIIRSSITNLGSETATFVISASGFESWAEFSLISERLLTLQAGETKAVVLNFNVNEDTKGQQSFLLEARSGEKLETREVAVNIEGAEESAPTTPQFNLGDNNLLWVIGIINVILIILIIIVAVRISRR